MSVHVSQHPLVQHKLTLLRRAATEHKKFRELIRELAMLLGYEATADLRLSETTVETPLAMARGYKLEEEIGLVPILRAGLGMVDGIHEMIPGAQVWHLGIYRDEKTLRPVSYYNKLPVEPTVQLCLVLDPMLATGGSMVHTLELLYSRDAVDVTAICVVAAPEGIAALEKAAPDVRLYTATVDYGLNESAYIVPGLGDAGDRQFGPR